MSSLATHRCASPPCAPHLARLDLDPRLQICAFDDGFIALIGERAHEYLGRPLAALVSPRDGARFDQHVQRGRPDSLDLTLRIGPREILSRLLLLRTGVGWLALIEDLDDPLAGRDLWRAVTHPSADGVAVLAADGRLLDYNPAFARLLGLRLPDDSPASDLRGQLLVDLLRAPSLAPLRDHLTARDLPPGELQHQGRWLEFTARPLALPHLPGSAVWLSLRDISERRRADELRGALEAARAELRRKDHLIALGGLADGLTRQLGAPLDAAVAAASFAQDQLHELRASFEAGILRQQDMRHLLRQALDAGDATLAGLRRAAALVAAVRQLGLDGEEPVRMNMSVGSYVHSVVAGLLPPYDGGRARVRVDIRADPIVPSFPAALAQIVTSLVHDALSRPPAAGRAGPVVVSVDRIGDQIELGCLAPPSESPVVPDRNLDLYIVRALTTDLLRGTLVTRPTERGHLVLVRFPVAPP